MRNKQVGSQNISQLIGPGVTYSPDAPLQNKQVGSQNISQLNISQLIGPGVTYSPDAPLQNKQVGTQSLCIENHLCLLYIVPHSYTNFGCLALDTHALKTCDKFSFI